MAAESSNGPDADSAAQGSHIRAVAAGRSAGPVGNVGPVTPARLRETVAALDP